MPATGSLVGDHCYETAQQAMDSLYSTSEPVFTAGSPSFLAYYQKVAGDWVLYQLSISPTGTVTAVTSYTMGVPLMPSCDPVESFTDGMTIGWGIATAMVLATCVLMMKRAAR